MQNYLVSIIIPVFNVEKYLRKCLDSAVGQTLKDIEIIIINDGSTDSSPSIIDEYADRDERIKVIHQNNRGLSAARNAGIRASSGEYLAFMDSDDWADLRFLEKMYMSAKEKKTDIAICGHIKVFENLGEFPVVRHFKSDIITGDDALRKTISDSEIQSFAWNKLYRRSLFTANNIFYPPGLYFEDMATTFKLFYYAGKVAIVNECLYYYLQRKNSISKMMDLKRVYDNITAVSLIRDFLEVKGVFAEYAHEYHSLCLKMLLRASFNLILIHRVTGEPGTYKSLRHAVRYINSLMTIKPAKKEESGGETA